MKEAQINHQERRYGLTRAWLVVAVLGLLALACAETPQVASSSPVEIKGEIDVPQALIAASVQLEMHPMSGAVECSGTIIGQVANALEVLTIEHCEPHIMGSNWVDPDGRKSEGVFLRHGGSKEVIKTEPVACEVIEGDLNEDNPTLCYLRPTGNYPSWFGILPDVNLGTEKPLQVGERVLTLSYPQSLLAAELNIEPAVVQWIGEIGLPENNIRQEEVCTVGSAYNGESGSILYRTSSWEAVAVVNSPCEDPTMGMYGFQGARRLPGKSELENWRNVSRTKYMEEYVFQD